MVEKGLKILLLFFHLKLYVKSYNNFENSIKYSWVRLKGISILFRESCCFAALEVRKKAAQKNVLFSTSSEHYIMCLPRALIFSMMNGEDKGKVLDLVPDYWLSTKYMLCILFYLMIYARAKWWWWLGELNKAKRVYAKLSVTTFKIMRK